MGPHTSTSPVGEQDDIVSEFISECREDLDQLESEIEELGRNPSADGLLASIFRAIHTIKGASGFLTFERLERLTHNGEGLLTEIREKRLPLSHAVSTTLLEMVDRIRDILDVIGATGTEGIGDDGELLSKIDRIQCVDRAQIYGNEMPSANMCGEFRSSGVNAEEDCTKPIGQLLVERAGVSPAAVQAARALQRQGDLRAMGEILVSQGMVTPTSAREILEYQQEVRAAGIGETSIRVEVVLLDKLISLAERVVCSGKRAIQLANGSHDTELAKASERVLEIAKQLHGEAMKTRVQPIGTLQGVLSRLVRDISKLSGKHVRLELTGSEIQVDRVLLGAIKDPLMHLVRNSIDHGIEDAQGRSVAGKPLEGCITLNASATDSHVIIEVSDDGAGIDLDKVKRKALSLGIVDLEQVEHLSPHEIASFVFLPGVTTVRRVSRISGRGVGMDVVKTKVENIGGAVELQSQEGRGTAVKMTIPLPQWYSVRGSHPVP